MSRKTHEQFVEESRIKFPQIEILSEYKGCCEVMAFKCKKHDFVFKKRASDFIHSKHGCNLCAREKIEVAQLKSNEWFCNELKRVNKDVEQIGEYKGMKFKVKVKCVHCGNVFESKPGDLLRNHSCYICARKRFAKNRTKDNDWFMDRLKQYNPHYRDIEIISDYTKFVNEIRCKCKTCSFEWETKASNLIDKRGGTGCPNCSTSKGEKIVRNYLLDHGIYFEQQKEFPCLVGVGGFPLLYDFYIQSKKTLIEVNGLQHYAPIKYFGGEEKFIEREEHDKRKRIYAKNHGYRLIEIKCPDSSYFGEIKSILQANL